ncbi:predicted protein [Nematostella vectensis]|uniref:SAM domain-containing protein n=1 Tax=Nematostella vectensis TaxID=45351 RepID=A7SU08_NEMVE|nr:predicted protein [Nematostella vectensis]|eukprot:XP_001624913.1 predicted protein [Nematostella vectensis]
MGCIQGRQIWVCTKGAKLWGVYWVDRFGDDNFRDDNFRDVNFRNDNFRDNNFRDGNFRDDNFRDANFRDNSFGQVSKPLGMCIDQGNNMEGEVDKELVQLLDLNSLGDLKATFVKNKVYTTKALTHLTESQYDRMGIAIGQVATIKSVLAEKSSAAPEACSREERIHTLMKKIREIGKEKEGKASNVPANRLTKSKKEATYRDIVLRVGWLHRRNENCAYKQVRLGEASVRKLSFKQGENITPAILLEKAARLFFFWWPLKSWTSPGDGHPCTYLTYLKEHGLFASRVTFYLMTTMKNSNVDWSGQVIDTKTSMQSTSDKVKWNTSSAIRTNEGSKLATEDSEKLFVVKVMMCQQIMP